MANVGTVVAQIGANISGYTSAMSQVSSSTSKAMSSASSSTNGATGRFGIMNSRVMDIAKGVGAVSLVSKGITVLKDNVGAAVSRFDTLNAYPKVMKQMGFSTEDTNKSIGILKKGVDGLPTSLQDITKSSQSFAILEKSATKGAKTATALNDAFLASHASAADASRGVEQYSQMLASGKVDLQSWKTLQETMPYALTKVANSFGLTGKSAERDLYAKLQSGEITIDQLNDKFMELDGGVNGFGNLARTTTGGISKSFTNMKTAVISGLANTLTAIDDGLKNAGINKGIAGLFDQAKGIVISSFNTINGVIKTSIPIIVNTVKGLFDFIKQNSDWLGPLVVGITAGVTAFKLIAGAVKAYEAVQEALDALMLVNPFILITTAIIAVVAGLVWWITQTKSGQAVWQAFTTWLSTAWSNMVSFFSGIWTGIVNVFNSAVTIIKAGWTAATAAFSVIWGAIVTFMAPIVTALQGVWTGFITAVTGIWNGMVSIATGVFNLLKTVVMAPVLLLCDLLTGSWGKMKSDATLIWNSIKSALGKIASGISTAVSGCIKGLAQALSSIWNGIKAVASNVWNGIKNIASSVWNGIKNVVVNLARGLVNGVRGAWSGIAGIASGIWNGVKNAINGAMHFDLAGAGRAIMNSFFNGLKAAWGGVQHFVSGIANWIRDHKGPISYDRKLLIPAGKAIMGGFGTSLNNNFEPVKTSVASYADQIAKQFGDQRYTASAELSTSSIGVAGRINGGLSDLSNEVKNQSLQQPIYEVHNEIIGDKIKTTVNNKNERRQNTLKFVGGMA